MSQPLEPLVTSEDEDWDSFQSKDPDWYLRVAGQEIRKYCGWHVWPSVTQTAACRVKSHGIIQLPSMMVTDVFSVVLQRNGQMDQVLDAGQYDWFSYGVIEPRGWSQWRSQEYGAYYGPDNWSYLPVYEFGLASVVFQSGYAVVPEDVKQVAFELATTDMEVNGGNVKEVQTPGFRLQPSQPFGANLNPLQEKRLAKYRLPAVA